jgi:hypothetical protein
MGRGGPRPNTGGARPGAGRKSLWQSSSKTKSIRVPEEIAEEVLGYAYRLDRQKAMETLCQSLASLIYERIVERTIEESSLGQSLELFTNVLRNYIDTNARLLDTSSQLTRELTSLSHNLLNSASEDDRVK